MEEQQKSITETAENVEVFPPTCPAGSFFVPGLGCIPIGEREEGQNVANEIQCNLGGWCGPYPATEEVQTIANEVRSSVELRYGDLKMYKAIEFKSQVVAGAKFEIKIQIEEEKYTVISVFQPLFGKEAEFKGFSTKFHHEVIPGGWSAIKRATDEIQKICDQLRPEVKKRYGFDVNFGMYLALQYQEQVVAGQNFRIWIQIDDALVFIEIEVFRGLDGTLTLTNIL